MDNPVATSLEHLPFIAFTDRHYSHRKCASGLI